MLIGHSMSDADGRLLAIDPAICEIMQRSEHELLGMSYADLTHPEDRSRNVDLVDRLQVHEGPISIRKRYVRPDASAIWVDVQVSRLAAGADRGRLVGTIQVANPNATLRGPESLWRSAHGVLEALQRRRDELGPDLFADHAWIILLQIYLGEAEGRIVDGAGIADRTRIARSIVGRWIRVLESKALVESHVPAGGAVQLTALGIAKIERLLDHGRR